jgi:two-component system cell cycle sensor histidine kinase/response regulator CckA
MTEDSKESIQPHVFVVDDDMIVRDVARVSLEEAGFMVSEAENGVQALEAVEHLKPDIILLDVMMPEMNGFDTCSALRKLPGCELIPILIMTALEDIESVNRAYEVGATDFATKPINWIVLVQRVHYMARAVRMMNERMRLEEELQQSQKLEAVATLAGGIAHDFNNLLQIVQGYSELLLVGKNKDESGYLELYEIFAAARRGGELTRQLLNYSRKVKSEKKPTDLNHQVRQIHKLLQRIIPKMIEIELQLEDDLQYVNADPLQVEQVLMNLAVNAQHAMPEEGKLVVKTTNATLTRESCSSHSKLTPGDYVLLSVSDTGHGMDSGTLEQIFEPFFSTKAPGKGTGLGLAMVYGIIENHNGHITCHSKPGKGTIFTIYFPTGETIQEISAEKAAKKETVLGGNETILLIDDDHLICTYAKRCLEKQGYKVLTAADGRSALELYRQKMKTIDLILLDLIMPGMGGAKCLQKLLEIDPDIKVVIASGYTPDDNTMQIIHRSTRGYLRKPYFGKQLLQTVRSVLRSH